MAEKIVWTPEETDLLVAKVLKTYPAGEYPTALQTVVFHLQKEVLPQSRWRNTKSGANTVPKVALRLEEIRKSGIVPSPEKKAPDTRPANPPVQDVRPAPREAHVEDVLADWLAGIFKGAIKRVLTDPDFQHIVQNLYPHPTSEGITSAIVAAGGKHDPTGTSETRTEKTKVLLCGIMPNQQTVFTQTFPDLHIKFWYSDKPGQGVDVLRSKAKWADRIFVKLAQNSHTVAHTLKGLGLTCTNLDGSVSTMMNALAELK